MKTGDMVVSGDIVNPTLGQVLCTSGVLDNSVEAPGTTGINIQTGFILYSSVAATLAFTVNNVGGTAVRTLLMRLAAGETRNLLELGIFTFQIPHGYSVRIIAPAAITGTVNATLAYNTIGVY